MDAQELLKTWPGIGNAGAETLLSLPAWRMTLDLDGRPAEMVRADAASGDEILLSLDLDGGDLTLGLSDSTLFPDLHLLWPKRSALPPALVLALVEKECGDVFSALEAATHKLLSVKGLADPAADGERMSFLLRIGEDRVPISLTRNRTVGLLFGCLQNIDGRHESIRELTRDVEAEYASYAPTEVSASALASGVRLLLPEKTVPHWRLDESPDDAFHLRGDASAKLRFGQLADDSLPPVPAPGRLKLVHRGSVVARGDVVSCGDIQAFCIREVS